MPHVHSVRLFSALALASACFAWGGIADAAGPAAVVAKPPLRLHPGNPRIFEFKGKPTVLVTSGEHYGSVLNLDFDFGPYLDELASRGLNYTRIFTGSYVELPGAFGIEKNTLAPAPGRLLAPWARSATAGYINGGNKFDLKRWDLAYFDRLKTFVSEASRRGIVVEISLFSSLYEKKGWEASPLHPQNNINDVNTSDRKKVHTLNNGTLQGYQEAMVRQIVRALADADNVFYEIQNEPWADLGQDVGIVSAANADSLVWQSKISKVIMQEGKRGTNVPVIAQNIANRSVKVVNPDPNVALLNFHYCRPPEAIAMNSAHPGAFGFDETGFDGSADSTYRKQGWHFVMAGGGLYNSLDYSFTTARENGTDSQKAPGGGSVALRTQLGTLSRFIHGFGNDLLTMRPDTTFIKAGASASVNALVSPGRAYAIYLSRGDLEKAAPVKLSIELPFGAYNVQWFDPATGASLSSTRLVHAGGLGVVAGPVLEADLAVRVVRSTQDPTIEELPSQAVAVATSPAGTTRIIAVLADMAGLPGYVAGKRLYYRVEQGSKAGRTVVLPWSPLGVRRADKDFVDGLTWLSVKSKTVRDRYKMVIGKQLDHDATAQETTLTLQGAQGGNLSVDLRAYDDGVAFRYRFAETTPGWFDVLGEETGFRVPTTAMGYLMNHDNPNQWKPAYEAGWKSEIPAGTTSPTAAGWSFPALFHSGEHWLLLTESGLDHGFAGSRLAADAPAGLYKVRLPDPEEGEGLGNTAPRWTLPWSMPWRVVVVGTGLNTIVESSLVDHLAAPSTVKDVSWIKPGRSSWSWWSDSDSPQDYARMLPFIDLSAQMGWEYFLVDANWDRMKGGDWKQLAAYAKSKNVRLLLWYNSGGPNNSVTEAPRDRMFEREKRRAEMKVISEAGIAGLKVDFFQSDKQDTIAQFQDLLADAADFKLLVNFHGCTIPRGWSRTYPNLMSHEAVRGAESYKFSKTFPVDAPAHNTILPFTRNAIGPMDYTPITFTDMNNPHQTTNGHELALSVVFESGFLHLADSVASYLGLPEAPKSFLKEIPVTWDETRFVAGFPGKQAVVARRKGKVWYVGGINGLSEASSAKVSLSFLGKSAKGSVDVTIIGDGNSDRAFASRTESHVAADTIEVPLRAKGGFVMRIVPTPRH